MTKRTPEGGMDRETREARRPGLSHRAMSVSRERARVEIPKDAVAARDEAREATRDAE